ncbi:hypothetical protein DAI22_11g000256 [Oryza sativa Japonica Group]|nr:hypothetical protein DAI22_11g000256 [Oryza sativa Japonica Group]
MASSASSVFAAFDKDGDGKVSASELRGCMAAALGRRCPRRRRRRSSQRPTPTATACWTTRRRSTMYAEEEETAVITPASLRRMLRRLGSEHQRLEMEECRAMICRFDLNGDGVLSFDEFRVMMLMA